MAQATLTDNRNGNVFKFGDSLNLELSKRLDEYSHIKTNYYSYEKVDNLEIDIHYSNGYKLRLSLDIKSINDIKEIFNTYIDNLTKEIKESIKNYQTEISNTKEDWQCKSDKKYYSNKLIKAEELLEKLEGK